MKNFNNRARLLTPILLFAAMALTWGCGSDDDNDDDNPIPDPTPTDTIPGGQKYFTEEKVEAAPIWQIDWKGSEEAPQWEAMAPDQRNYENIAIVIVRLEDELAQYSTSDDMMAVFVGDELRALSWPATWMDEDAEGKGVYFILRILANESNNETIKYTLKYYSSSLHQVFTRSGSEKFEYDQTYGAQEDFIPILTEGSTKYPVKMDLTTTPMLTNSQSPFTAGEGDMVAVMVDGECRGKQVVNPDDPLAPLDFKVFGRQEGEKGTVCYYSKEWNTILTYKEPVVINDGKKKNFYLYFI